MTDHNEILNFIKQYNQNLSSLTELNISTPNTRVFSLFKNATKPNLISNKDICRLVTGCMDGRFVYCYKSQRGSFFNQDGEIFGSTFYAKGAGNCSLLNEEAVEDYFEFYIAKFPNLKEIDIQAHHGCGAHGLRWQGKSEEDIYIDIIRLSRGLEYEDKMFLAHELSKFNINYYDMTPESKRDSLLTTHALLWAKRESEIVKKLKPSIEVNYNLMRPQKYLSNFDVTEETKNGLIKDVGEHRENGINITLLDSEGTNVINTQKILEWQAEVGFTGFNYTQIIGDYETKIDLQNVVELSYRIANGTHSVHLTRHNLAYQISLICFSDKAINFANLAISQIREKFKKEGFDEEKITKTLQFNILVVDKKAHILQKSL